MSTLPDSSKETCPLCNSSHIGSVREQHEVEGTTYDLYECTECRVQFWVPFKNPGAAWYEHDERYADRNSNPIRKPNKKHKDVLTFLEKQPGRVLDVGCGVGNFLAAAKEKGWDGWGIDFDHDAIAAGRRLFGLEHLTVASLQEFVDANPNQQFDLITFFDVFEHIDNHREFLELVKKLLAPGGHIALSLPYRNAWRWLMQNDFPPRHLTRWDDKALDGTLLRSGFRTVFRKHLAASVYFITLKIRFKYGKQFSLGLVRKVQMAAQSSTALAQEQKQVKAVRILATMKDLILFGIPALLIWVVLLPTQKRYTDVYLVAERV